MDALYNLMVYVLDCIKLILVLFFLLDLEMQPGKRLLWIPVVGTAVMLAATLLFPWWEGYALLFPLAVGFALLKHKRKFYAVVFSFIVMSVVELIIASVFYWALGYSMHDIDEHRLANIAVYTAVLALLGVACFLHRKRRPAAQMRPAGQDGKSAVLLFFCGISLLALLMYIVPTQAAALTGASTRQELRILIGSNGVAIALLVFMGIGYYSWARQRRLEGERHWLQSTLQHQIQYYEALGRQAAGIRKLRHDTAAHVAALQQYLQAGETEKAQEYLARMDESTKAEYLIVTGNEMLNAVANGIFAGSRCHVRWKGFLPPTLRMDDFDVCVLFANLLKNAREAAEQADSGPAEILVDIKGMAAHMHITVQNRSAAPLVLKNNLPVVKHKGDRGYGIANILDVLEKHDATIEYRNAGGGNVVAEVFIPNSIAPAPAAALV